MTPPTSWTRTPAPLPPSRWQFPDAREWPEHDLVCGGADLEPSTLIDAYQRGLFPMLVSGLPDVLGWWSPDPRGVLPLDQLRVARSLRQSGRKFEVRVDTRFVDVMRGCADPSREDGWITQEFVDAYAALHQLGWAHSIEVFNADAELVGGLYGVRIGRFFAGESMFHRERDASKVALVSLVSLMQESGMTLLDTQWSTPHLSSLGVVDVPREAYLANLRRAVDVPSEG